MTDLLKHRFAFAAFLRSVILETKKCSKNRHEDYRSIDPAKDHPKDEVVKLVGQTSLDRDRAAIGKESNNVFEKGIRARTKRLQHGKLRTNL